MAPDKVRIRFRKSGDLRFVSHHDLMRCFERMLRRAALPVRNTAGFNPKPRLIFALSLGLGIVGSDEVVELELDEEVAPEEVQTRLSAQAPSGLEIVQVRRIDPRAQAQVRRVGYRVQIPPDRLAGLPARITETLASPEIWVDRTRPQPRRIDLRPYLCNLRLVSDILEIELWVTPNGTARAEEILAQVGLADLLEAGAVLERFTLELHDELVEHSADTGQPALPPAVGSLSGPLKGTP